MNARCGAQFRAMLVAGLTGVASLSAAILAGGQMRRAALKTSHQQPTPEEWIESPSPTSPALIKQGRTLFLNNCAHCHGIDASGDEGPDLHDLEVSDRFISNQIAKGVKGEMPSFAKKLQRDDITRLTAYLRSLAGEENEGGH